MKETKEIKSGCIAFAAKVLGDKWNLLIIRNLCDGCQRFSVLQQMMKINPRTLSARLDFLEEHDIISRKVFAQVPVKVEYSLTNKGRDLIPIFNEMSDWGEKYEPAN